MPKRIIPYLAVRCNRFPIWSMKRMNNRIGILVKRERTRQGLTLQALEKKSGVHYRNICLWEHGKGDIPLSAFVKLALALELSAPEALARILEGDDELV